MLNSSTLPLSVGVAARVTPPVLVDRLCLTSEDLSALFAASCSISAPTQAPPSTPKDIKRALGRLHSFSPAHLNVFLRGNLSGRAPVPLEALNGILRLAAGASGEWAHRCQSLALSLLLAELSAPGGGGGPPRRARPDDPQALATVRSALPDFAGAAPAVSVGGCHFCFVGDPLVDDGRPFVADVLVRNEGNARCAVRVGQTHTVVDGGTARGDFFTCASTSEIVIQQGKEATLHFSLRALPPCAVSSFQQVVVLTIDDIVKIFVTFLVLSPRQRPFGVGIPRCLSLNIVNSPLGAYTSPLMLQLLKHQFVRQQGLASCAAVRLFVAAAPHCAARNSDVLREATRVRELLEDELDMGDVLATYWSALPRYMRSTSTLPQSAAQPAGYRFAGLLPTDVADVSSMSCFPNAATRLPVALTSAAPEVLMALILIWLAEFDAPVFGAGIVTCEPMAYLESLPPHIKGVALWAAELGAAMLAHKDTNGVSLRRLALTFAAVLMRRQMTEGPRTDSVFTPLPLPPPPTTTSTSTSTTAAAVMNAVSSPVCGMDPARYRDETLADIAIQQSAVTAFVHWITVCTACYAK